MASGNLPQEILVEILRGLPTKSILRFTSVCKSWHSLITDPSFISLHHSHSPSFFLLQLFKEPSPLYDNPIHFSLRHDDPLFTESNSSLLLPSPYRQFSMVAVCHGLLCLSEDEKCSSLVICNPSIRRFLPLPEPVSYPVLYFAALAFSFDSRNNDYKIVRISCLLDDYRYGLSAPAVEVFSLASGFWRTLPPAVAPVCSICGDAPYSFVNGLAHWGAMRCVGEGRGKDGEESSAYYLFVLSFDFEEEVFHEVVLPECLAHTYSNLASVTVVGGGYEKALTVYHLDIDSCNSGSIWVMKEYGVVESWNKLFAFDMRGFCLEAPSFGMAIGPVPGPPSVLCVRNSREILLVTTELGRGRMYLVDLERKRYVDLQIGREDYIWWFCFSGYYVESLVLLDNAGALMSY